jgi:hypothetical protein
MGHRILEDLVSLLSELPNLIIRLFTDNQEVLVVCLVIMLAYWCFLQER